MTNDLATWLLEQIAEDERIARDEMERRARWHAEQEAAAARGSVNAVIFLPFDDPGAPGDPARVLAECDAKRRIVDMWQRAMEAGEMATQSVSEHARYAALDDVLELLALPYAARPGYQEEWRP